MLLTYFIAAAATYLEKEWKAPFLSTVIGCMLLGTFHQVSAQPTLGWTYEGIGVRIANVIGLHMDSRELVSRGIISPELQRARSYCWATVAFQDKLWCVCLLNTHTEKRSFTDAFGQVVHPRSSACHQDVRHRKHPATSHLSQHGCDAVAFLSQRSQAARPEKHHFAPHSEVDGSGGTHPRPQLLAAEPHTDSTSTASVGDQSGAHGVALRPTPVLQHWRERVEKSHSGRDKPQYSGLVYGRPAISQSLPTRRGEWIRRPW